MAEKKFSKTITNPETGREKTVRYGAKDPNSPLRLSRAKWKCVAKKSKR